MEIRDDARHDGARCKFRVCSLRVPQVHPSIRMSIKSMCCFPSMDGCIATVDVTSVYSLDKFAFRIPSFKIGIEKIILVKDDNL